ncbi:NADPH:quinone reductase [Brachybacterium endophyticum]|uniref:NADPH:quinone reductase n=1 Tax=Brachybacterium endophyticum TaxID=2182385 RepID=A0A2U2RHH7_9MICO|nr:NADP-dependent oxidoreductase [Brachybacterium endophyticum]PWH05304.1 NADPH:quinone reductase [Brachybacterium endophyticum]
MKAARFHSFGGPEVISVEEAPEPHAIPGSVRIAVRAVSVNPIDTLVRAGALHEFLPLPFPIIPGRDAVGVVDEIGDGVEGVDLGDVVFGLGGISDTTAEFAVLTSWSPVPGDWSTEQAAAAGLAASTAAAALEALGDIDGTTILIEGASGAVGTAAVAIARDLGATVIGTGSQSNADYIRSLGATATSYGDGLVERVRALAPAGVDAALQLANAPSLPDLVEIVGDPQRVVTVTDGDGAARLGAQRIDARNDPALLDAAVRLGRQGQYIPRVDQTLPLARISEAQERAATNGGKIVVEIA